MCNKSLCIKMVLEKSQLRVFIVDKNKGEEVQEKVFLLLFLNQEIEILDILENGMLSLVVALICLMNSEAHSILWKNYIDILCS